MENNLIKMIREISAERKISPQAVFKAIKEAISEASKKYFGANEIVDVDFNEKTGEVKVYVKKKVVQKVVNEAKEIAWEQARKIFPDVKIGKIVEINLPAETLGRIAAQVAKNIIFQKVREAEKEMVFREFSPKIGELTFGIIRRFDNDDVIVDLEKAEGVLPKKERPENETYPRGDMIKVLIKNVLKDSKGPQVILSRSDPKFLIKLLELEIPEISEGIIEIKGISRIPGERSKVAVWSKEKDVDPVGSCIGMKGARISSLLKELRGEKIDIIPWSPNIEEYVRAALSPAKVDKISILNTKERTAEIIVSSDQLSLAIGKKGHNVKLASRLLEWKIEIKSNEEKIDEILKKIEGEKN
ncbi:MAG: transcription termination factor NusA [Acidobacteriota bacterium]